MWNITKYSFKTEENGRKGEIMVVQVEKMDSN